MTIPIREQQRQFVQIWQQAGDIMEQMRRENLRNLPYRWQDVDALLELGNYYAGPARATSGLVEMQKWFMELARQQGLLSPAVGEPPGEYQAGTGKSGGPTSASVGIGRDRAHPSRNRGFIKPDKEP